MRQIHSLETQGDVTRKTQSSTEYEFWELKSWVTSILRNMSRKRLKTDSKIDRVDE